MHMINFYVNSQYNWNLKKKSNHILKVTCGQTGVQLCLSKSFATILSLETGFVKHRKLSTITLICDNGDHLNNWTTGEVEEMHLFIFVQNENWERAVQWEFTDYSFLESIMLKNLCKKISEMLYCTLSRSHWKIVSSITVYLGTRSYCIWSWQPSIFYLFVFKPTPSIFTSSTLAFNTFTEKK